MRLLWDKRAHILAFGTLLAVSAYLWRWVLEGDFGACVIGTTEEALQQMVAALDSTMELGITLSVTLVGAAAAVILGVKSGLRLTPWSKTLLLVAAMLFGQAAASAVYWKLKIAFSWLNMCLNLVYEPLVQRAFDATLLFFSLGLLCALVLLFVAAWQGRGEGEENAAT